MNILATLRFFFYSTRHPYNIIVKKVFVEFHLEPNWEFESKFFKLISISNLRKSMIRYYRRLMVVFWSLQLSMRFRVYKGSF